MEVLLKTSVTKHFSVFQCLVVYETEFQKTIKCLRTKNYNVATWFNKKSTNFRGFWVFDFAPILKIENSEISESFTLLKFLIVYENQNRKNNLKEKQLNFTTCFEKKMFISGFSILPFTWNWKPGNLGKFSFASSFYCLGCMKHGKD